MSTDPAYHEDLAAIHDAGFTELARSAAGLALAELASGPPGPVVDLGCGGGVTAGLIADGGREVIGVDISAAQIALARQRVPAATFHVGSFVDFELPQGCAAILAVGEIVNYAFDERTGQTALGDLIARAARALAPGGLLLFDSAGPGRVSGSGPTRSFAEGEGWAILYEATETDEPPEVVRRMTTFRQAGTGWRRETETHRLHLFPRDVVLGALDGAGLEAEVRSGYEEQRFAPGLDIFVARRGG